MDKNQILKVIVGSQAHGLATPESDYDYRGVFIVPTSEILKLGGSPKTTLWIEGNDDNTSWEISHFLDLATHCNATILETFLAPVAHYGDPLLEGQPNYGKELRELFPYIWNSQGVRDAFVGYSKNQEKKFLDKKDNRAPKYAAAYLRVLYNAWELLSTGTFTIRIADTPIGDTVRRFKNRDYTIGEVMQTCADWQNKVEEAFLKNPDKKANLEPINEFLLKVRKENW